MLFRSLKAGDKIVAKEGACYDIKIDNKQFYMVDAIGVVCRIKGEKLSLETIDLIPAIEVNHAEHY